MEQILQTWIQLFSDPITVIKAGGYMLIALLVFGESGVLIGIFINHKRHIFNIRRLMKVDEIFLLFAILIVFP